MKTWWLSLAVAFLFLARSAWALIPVTPPSIDGGIKVSKYVLVAKVKSLELNKLVLVVHEDLKGKAPFRELHVDLTPTRRLAAQLDHGELLRERLARGLPLVVFCNQRSVEPPEAHTAAFAYTNGTWFQLIGTGPKQQAQGWVFIKTEPTGRRAFTGTTAELRQIVIDALAGKKPPPPNPKEPPGLGPEVKTDGTD